MKQIARIGRYHGEPVERTKLNVVSFLEDACRQICEKEYDYGEDCPALFEQDLLILIKEPGRHGDGETAP